MEIALYSPHDRVGGGPLPDPLHGLPHADFIEMAHQISRILVDAVRPGLLRFLFDAAEFRESIAYFDAHMGEPLGSAILRLSIKHYPVGSLSS